MRDITPGKMSLFAHPFQAAFYCYWLCDNGFTSTVFHQKLYSGAVARAPLSGPIILINSV